MSELACAEVAVALPSRALWQDAAAGRPDLFGPLDAGARLALVARRDPQSMLLWQAEAQGTVARIEPFAGFAASGDAATSRSGVSRKC